MQFTVMRSCQRCPPPEVVAKTDQSITLRVQPPRKTETRSTSCKRATVSTATSTTRERLCLFTGKMFPTYVFRVRIVHEAKRQCGEWSPLTPITRTFTEEEDAKRSGTVFEHALKLEREQKSILQGQISKLTGMLDETQDCARERQQGAAARDMLASRRIIDTRLMKLQQELSSQTAALQTIKSQRVADEQMISELLNEQEKLRVAQNEQQGQAQYELEMQTLRAQLEKNEEALRKHQEQVNASHEQISSYEESLEGKKNEIAQKEEEVERIMADCNRMVQEQADLAHVKQLEVEDALLEAKTSLEQQLDINTYLREEVSRLREENHHLKNQIEEVDSEVVPKLVRLEDENEQLRAQLNRR
ncbi:hypothetical protein GQ600_14800 [Phytophthora cactorum]|nr:hypothetical protein GQ600_14800 [Phytophthora cactorum]